MFQTFTGRPGQRLTLTILEMDIEPAAWGEIVVYDGRYVNHDPILARYEIRNGTMPQGATSTDPYMVVVFKWSTLPQNCPTLIDCIKITIMVDSGPGLSHINSYKASTI